MPAYEVVVDVMLKPEILDPAGQAVVNALPSLGLAPVSGLRIGKHVEITVDAEDEDAALAEGARMAEVLLANPVIEDFSVRLGQDARWNSS
jgi:phosphoribosylformylglycinamidine synthase PurS subunit